MDNLITTASRMLNVELITKLASKAVNSQPVKIQEILVTSKSEQTFSGLLANQMLNYGPLVLGNKDDLLSGSVLLEFKGKDYTKRTSKGIKNSRNFHDLAVVNQQGQFEVIIENKFWYHFDGCKGKKNPKPEKGIGEQIEGDIYKIRQTFEGETFGKKGFLLLNIVTPGGFDNFPLSYKKDHKTVLNRTNSDMGLYRAEGLNGILQTINHFQDQILDGPEVLSISIPGGGFIDFISAEIN